MSQCSKYRKLCIWRNSTRVSIKLMLRLCNCCKRYLIVCRLRRERLHRRHSKSLNNLLRNKKYFNLRSSKSIRSQAKRFKANSTKFCPKYGTNSKNQNNSNHRCLPTKARILLRQPNKSRSLTFLILQLLTKQ